MGYLILGLVVFLGVHSVRIVAEDWRNSMRARMGENYFKGRYSLVSLVGFALIIWGFGIARETPVLLWSPPAGMRHAASLLTLVAFVLLAAAYVPRNAIKARVHHPMVLGIKSWALAHLMATGGLAQLVLFGSFLAWGVVLYITSRRRDRALGTTYPAGTAMGTVMTIVIGVAAWALFAFKLHGLLMGIRPFG